MGLWYECGNGYALAQFAKKDIGCDTYLVCPGPSLKNVDSSKLRGRGRKIFAINTAYPYVKPDVWMGLDKIECYDRNLWYEPFMKICRGTYYEELELDGKKLKYYPDVYWASLKEPEKDKTLFDYRSHKVNFVWYKNTMAAMLHVMVWMGARTIHLIGCDMGGIKDYYDDRVLSDEQRNYNRRLYKEQVKFIRTFNEQAKKYGISVISCTPDSPLNEFLPYKDVEVALKDSEDKTIVKVENKIVHALDTVKKDKIGVVVPTRGDRSEFLEQCKKMIAYQTVQPDKVYIIDRKPTKDSNDQRERIIEGVEQAKKDGMNKIIIIEDDDYYYPNYIETCIKNWKDNEIIGNYYYLIYHLRDKQYVEYHADMNFGTGIKGAPLHSTCFTVDLWDKFIKANYLYTQRNLDEELWKYVQDLNIKRDWIKEKVILSIKHGVGKCAGGNHAGIRKQWAKDDPNFEYLRKHVTTEIYNFYEKNFYKKSDMKVGVVVPTRRDRHRFLDQCKKMIEYQTVKPDGIYIVDRPPTKDSNDQRERVTEGIEQAKKDGINRIIIIEDDDYYPPDYIETVLNNWKEYDLIGGYNLDCFNLRDKNHVSLNVDQLKNYYKSMFGKEFKTAALHSTSFTVNTWDNFLKSDYLYKKINLDEELWSWAQDTNVNRTWIKTGIVSIKHGIGSAAGWNHKQSKNRLATQDEDLTYLKERVVPEMFEFYKNFYDNEITVYTSIVGDVDEDRDDCLVFKGDEKFTCPKMQSNLYFSMPHKFIDSFYSIRLSGFVYLKKPKDVIVRELLGDADMAVFKHYKRNCIYDEAEMLIKMINHKDTKNVKDRFDSEEVIRNVVERYKKEGYPENNGLCELGFLVRRNTEDVKKFNEAWFAELCTGSKREQMSFNYILSKFPNIKVNFIEGTIYENDYVELKIDKRKW